MATAVISANEAMHYVKVLLHEWPVIPATIGLLAFFMTLSIVGIRESSNGAPGAVLDRTYPAMRIEFLILRGEFGPDLIAKLSAEWRIPPNFMFIGSPGDRFPFRVSELGGMRLII